MKKKISIVLIIIVLALTSILAYKAFNREKTDNWVHETFQGEVVDIWTDENNSYFSISSYVTENEYRFVMNEDTLYSIDFEIGDNVIVESDYNTNEHNGKTVPYPAILVTDPNIHDGE